MVSVLMSVYKEPLEYLDQAINSVLFQSYSEIEFIIVVDAPLNINTIEFLKKRSDEDPRIKIIVNKENIGLAKSLNVALTTSTGEYIARMDADDIAKPNRIEKEIEYLEKNNLDMVSCAVELVDENGNKWGEIHPFSEKQEDIFAILPFQNLIVHPTVLMRRDKIEALKGYRNFASCQDYDLWLRFYTAGYSIGMMDEILLSFRRHRDSITATRRFNQSLNEQYIQQLYQERVRNGFDDFSEANLEKYLVRHGYRNEEKFQKENNALRLFSEGLRNIKSKNIVGFRQCLQSLISENVRHEMLTKINVKIRKYWIQRGNRR